MSLRLLKFLVALLAVFCHRERAGPDAHPVRPLGQRGKCKKSRRCSPR